MNRIPLEHYLKVIPKLRNGLEKDGTGKVETGIKFNAIYKLFFKNKIVGGRDRNKVFLDLQYYCELGHFFKKQNENEQPNFIKQIPKIMIILKKILNRCLQKNLNQ